MPFLSGRFAAVRHKLKGETQQPDEREQNAPGKLYPVFFCLNGLTSRTECDIMKRGDIYRADLDPVVGSEQGGVRPVLIIQNDTGNLYSPTVIVAAITGRPKKTHMPVHVHITAEESGLPADSVVLTEQVRTLEKSRLTKYLGHLPDAAMVRIDAALDRSLGRA